MLGSSRVIPQYDMMSRFISSKASCHLPFSSLLYEECEISRLAAFNLFQQPVR